MCSGTAPVPGPPIRLPLGQTLTQAKPKIVPGAPGSTSSSSSPTVAPANAPPSPTRGHNVNLAV